MLLEIIEVLGIFYFFTWFIWPVVFIFSLLYAINDIVKSKKPTVKAIIASISLLLIICGLMTMIMSVNK